MVAYGDSGTQTGGMIFYIYMSAETSSLGSVLSHQKISGDNGEFTANLDGSDLLGSSFESLGDVDSSGMS